jgi:hypothetical protein
MLWVIAVVLADATAGMRAVEVGRDWSCYSGRPVSQSTVDGPLANNREVERVRRGVYWLRDG